MTKDAKCEDYLCNCLYFTSNKLNRIINRMAEEEFLKTGLSPSHAFALMTINSEAGLSQNELSKILGIKPSTTSRFIDKLESKRLVRRKVKGKVSYLYPTSKGEKLQEEIQTCWKNLHYRYSKILGEKEGSELTATVYKAADELENKFND
ncbi:MarR family winged helix-turn-helix transcriptional regulator [Methanobacterium oryzae]|uniref:MarR family winged helix-turn-helix transcriptional regulator n=1 Tax=Methanobacterium oryzae TaxID=69540 RepID=UPI003D1F0270